MDILKEITSRFEELLQPNSSHIGRWGVAFAANGQHQSKTAAEDHNDMANHGDQWHKKGSKSTHQGNGGHHKGEISQGVTGRRGHWGGFTQVEVP